MCWEVERDREGAMDPDLETFEDSAGERSCEARAKEQRDKNREFERSGGDVGGKCTKTANKGTRPAVGITAQIRLRSAP